MQLDALMPSPPPAAERGQRTIRPNCLRPLSRFGVTNARDVALARSQVTTLRKAQPAPQFGDDDGAVAHNDDDDDDDDRPVVHNDDDDDDWAVAQLWEQQQRWFAVENQEREARHTEELAAAVNRREEAQGAAEPDRSAKEWAWQPHNRGIIRKGNYDGMMLELLDYGNIVAGTPGEFVVVILADTHLFSDTEARPARCSLSTALQAEAAEIGTLYRTQTPISCRLRTPGGWRRFGLGDVRDLRRRTRATRSRRLDLRRESSLRRHYDPTANGANASDNDGNDSSGRVAYNSTSASGGTRGNDASGNDSGEEADITTRLPAHTAWRWWYCRSPPTGQTRPWCHGGVCSRSTCTRRSKTRQPLGR